MTEPVRVNRVTVARTVPLDGLQKVVARRMAESQAVAAHVTAMAEADADPLFALLGRLRTRMPELSLTHLLVKVTALCLRRHPRLNATLVDDSIHEFAEVNVAVALSLPSSDLQLAVIKAADEKPLERIAAEMKELQDRATAGKLSPGDVRGGTFTVSNYGMLRNVVWATPIITPGQVGVLGVARAVPRLVAADSAAGWERRLVLPLSLTYDHRVINGVPAGEFVDDLVETVSGDDWFDEEEKA